MRRSRTTVLDVAARGVDVHGLIAGAANHDFVLVPQRPADTLELRVRFRGDAPRDLECVACRRQDVAEALRSPDRFWQVLGPRVPAVPAAPTGPRYREAFTQREQRLAARPCGCAPGCECEAFGRMFLDLDRNTFFPMLVAEEHADGAPLERLFGYVQGRTETRATRARYGLTLGLQPADGDHRADAEVGERILRDVLTRALASADGGIDLRRLDAAVCDFVLGKLEIPVDGTTGNVHGAPNTSSFFGFAEACFLFGDLHLNAAFWRGVARPFVVGAEVFAHLYWSGEGRQRDDYHHRYLGRNGTFDRQRWRALDQVFDRWPRMHSAQDAMIEEYFGDVVARALRDRTLLSPDRGLFLAPSKPRPRLQPRTDRAPTVARPPAHVAYDAAPGGALLPRSATPSPGGTTMAKPENLTPYMTLEERCSDLIGKPLTPTGALLTYWNDFKSCVQDAEDDHPCEQPSSSSDYNEAIWKHIRDVIGPCLTEKNGDVTYTLLTGAYVPSRQGSGGWDPFEGASNCAVVENATSKIVCHFGCERV
ncbi:MAG: hypothetical protein AB7O97_06060 [Planctomycetota bacterium]